MIKRNFFRFSVFSLLITGLLGCTGSEMFETIKVGVSKPDLAVPPTPSEAQKEEQQNNNTVVVEKIVEKIITQLVEVEKIVEVEKEVIKEVEKIVTVTPTPAPELPPVLFHVVPALGGTAGGTEVIVIGNHFKQGLGIKFGENPCTEVRVTTVAIARCIIPASDQVGPVDVEVRSAVGADSQKNLFSYGYDRLDKVAGAYDPRGYADGIGIDARFYAPIGVASDGNNLYIADASNHLIRSFNLETKVVTTLAGQAKIYGFVDGGLTSSRFYTPAGMVEVGGSLYISDNQNHCIRSINLEDGIVEIFAGARTAGHGDGPGTSSKFYNPHGIATDGTNLYVADYSNQVIRKIVIETREVSTLAGIAGARGAVDGALDVAKFYAPVGVAFLKGDLYVADYGNHTVRKIALSQTPVQVSTIAGLAARAGSTDGVGSIARFYYPYYLATDGQKLFLTDHYNHAIRSIDVQSGQVTTLAGELAVAGSEDGDLPYGGRFYYPSGIFYEGGILYVSDSGNHTLRYVDIAHNKVGTLAGLKMEIPAVGYLDGENGDGTRFRTPRGIAVVGNYAYVADYDLHRIRRTHVLTGETRTFAGAGTIGSSDGSLMGAQFYRPMGMATDGDNLLFVADTSNQLIRKIDLKAARVYTIAGSPRVAGSSDGIGVAASFRNPQALATDGKNIYVSDTDNNTIRKIVIATGEVSTFAGADGKTGLADGVGILANFNKPIGLAMRGSILYVADYGNHSIRRIDTKTANVTTLAGLNGSYGYADGQGTHARFYNPFDITTDGTKLYVTDYNNYVVRIIDPVSGNVSTMTSRASQGPPKEASGSLSEAYLVYPTSMAFSPFYGIFVVSPYSVSRIH